MSGPLGAAGGGAREGAGAGAGDAGGVGGGASTPGSPGAGLNSGGGVLVGTSSALHNPGASATTSASVAQRSAVARVCERERRTVGEAGEPDPAPTHAGTSAAFGAEAGALYVVATPIGNLRDVTLRALEVLRTVDVVAAEDTRVTATLLSRHGIATRPISVRAHNEAQSAERIIAALAQGRSVALVSDAGTPAVSDPGARLVHAVRAAGHRVVPIPGPSALATAVSAAGLSAERFAFLGFLPPQPKAREALVRGCAALPLALVVYEAPHRVRETLAELYRLLGARRVVVARELTKAFETITALDLADAATWMDADPNRERGELVLIVDAAEPAPAAEELPADAQRWLEALLAELPPARAARLVAEVAGVSRKACYARALALKGEDG